MYRFAFYVLLGGVLAASLYPRPNVSDIPGGDQVVHFAMYFVLALSAGLGWHGRPLGFLVALVCLGLTLEFAQISIPGRGFEWADATANAFGALSGVVVLVAVTSGWRRFRRETQ